MSRKNSLGTKLFKVSKTTNKFRANRLPHSIFASKIRNAGFGIFLLLLKKLHNQCFKLLYGHVSQGLGTTDILNIIGRNRFWLWSSFFHLDQHLDWSHFAVKFQTKTQNIDYLLHILNWKKNSKSQMRKKQTLWDLNSAQTLPFTRKTSANMNQWH